MCVNEGESNWTAYCAAHDLDKKELYLSLTPQHTHTPMHTNYCFYLIFSRGGPQYLNDVISGVHNFLHDKKRVQKSTMTYDLNVCTAFISFSIFF